MRFIEIQCDYCVTIGCKVEIPNSSISLLATIVICKSSSNISFKIIITNFFQSGGTSTN